MASRNKETADDFCSKMSNVVSGGYLCLAMALGNRAGLWDLLSSFDEPKTAKEISEAAGMQEKYIKEWLGAVVSGGIVDIDRRGESFFLPAHRRSALTEGSSGATNYSEFACGLPVLMKDFEHMPTAMKTGGKGIEGLTWDDKCPGWAWYQHLSLDFMKSHMVSGVVSTNKALKQQLEKGIGILEVGCDVGTATNAIAEHFPKSTVVGIDINDEALKTAKEDASLKKITNVSYYNKDIYKLPSEWSGRYEHVYAIDTIHGLRPKDSLKEIARVLTPKGTLNLIELKGNARMIENKDLVNAPYLYVSGLVMALQDGDHDHGDGGHDHGHGHGDHEDDEQHHEHGTRDNGHSPNIDDQGPASKKAKYECEHSKQANENHGQDSEIRPCGEGPGWWWGKSAIIKTVKEAGFQKVEEHKIPGSYTHVVYVCKK